MKKILTIGFIAFLMTGFSSCDKNRNAIQSPKNATRVITQSQALAGVSPHGFYHGSL